MNISQTFEFETVCYKDNESKSVFMKCKIIIRNKDIKLPKIYNCWKRIQLYDTYSGFLFATK